MYLKYFMHAPTYQISLTYPERQKSYGPDKLRWEEAEEEEAGAEKNQTKTIWMTLTFDLKVK
jgi:hypothetical protein